MSRNSQADAGRKGRGARSLTKADLAMQCPPPAAKGVWKTAYSGSVGLRDDEGTAADEVGNGRDSEYGD